MKVFVVFWSSALEEICCYCSVSIKKITLCCCKRNQLNDPHLIWTSLNTFEFLTQGSIWIDQQAKIAEIGFRANKGRYFFTLHIFQLWNTWLLIAYIGSEVIICKDTISVSWSICLTEKYTLQKYHTLAFIFTFCWADDISPFCRQVRWSCSLIWNSFCMVWCTRTQLPLRSCPSSSGYRTIDHKVLHMV